MNDKNAPEDILLEERVRFCGLFDVYGSILTEKQRAMCELMLREDLSVSELASELGVTRQAAHDLVRRTRDLLWEMEKKLGLKALTERMDRLSDTIRDNERFLPENFFREAVKIIES